MLVGKMKQVGPIAGVSAVVIHGLMTAIFTV
jgi:hypothetical protein